MHRLVRTAVAAAVVLLLAPAAAYSAQAQPPDAAAGPSYAQTTSVGAHNAYEKDAYPYLADALDSGASLIEIDVWTNPFGNGWRVAHDSPLGNDRNCENAASPADLRTGPRDQDFGGCLADMAAWHEARPGHRPVMVKVELKDGFHANGGRGPAAFDALLQEHLGDAVFGPGDLMAGGGYADLDEAARAGAWPERDALAGKFLFELIPGTVEEGNPGDTLWTDREYALHLRDLAGSGRLAEAGAFPAVHGAEAGDPRERYEAALRPWFVVFDGDASAYVDGGVDGGVDTGWYAARGYLLVMTAAHAVAPPIDARHPSEQQARDRVHLLAERHASFATSDWYDLPQVLSMVVPRGA